MEYYTKDMILNLNYKEGINTNKFKEWTSKLKKIIKNNKIIFICLTMLITLISADLMLISSFLNILSE